MIDVSIIIINYNTYELTRNCINSIIKHTTCIDYEIILVDNNSADDSFNKLKKDFSNITFIKNDRNIGFGAANNKGARIASGKYLFLLNSDTILQNNALLEFYNFYNTNNIPNRGVIGCFLKDSHGRNNEPGNFFPSMKFYLKQLYSSLFYKLFHIKNKNPIYSNEKIPVKIDFVIGADMFLPKDLFFRFDGFDEKFFMYFEETDLQYRMNKHGFFHFIIPGPEIIHLEGGSTSKVKIKKRIMLDQSMFHYFKKHSSSTLSYYTFKILYFLRPLLVLLSNPCKDSFLYLRLFLTKFGSKYNL